MNDNKLVFGDEELSIELYHEPTDQGHWFMCGRLHMRFGKAILGDLSEEKTNFSGVYVRLSEIAGDLSEIIFSEDRGSADEDVFNFLNSVLYLDSGQSNVEIEERSNRYSKYNFMTNVCEIFDRTKSFIFIRRGTEAVSICFQTEASGKHIHCRQIGKVRFLEVIQQFQRWYENTNRLDR